LNRATEKRTEGLLARRVADRRRDHRHHRRHRHPQPARFAPRRQRSSVRTIGSAEATYAATFGNGSYVDLATLAGQKLIDGAIANSSSTTPKSGYFFAVNGASNAGYVSGGVPVNANVGTRMFTSTEAGIIYADAAGTATAVPNATQGSPIGN
jgi:hypothetical protein